MLAGQSPDKPSVDVNFYTQGYYIKNAAGARLVTFTPRKNRPKLPALLVRGNSFFLTLQIFTETDLIRIAGS